MVKRTPLPLHLRPASPIDSTGRELNNYDNDKAETQTMRLDPTNLSNHSRNGGSDWIPSNSNSFRNRKSDYRWKSLLCRTLLLFSAVGVLFLFFISYLILKQPFLIPGIQVKYAERVSLTARRAGYMYGGVVLLCLLCMYLDARGDWLLRQRLSWRETISLFSSSSGNGNGNRGHHVSYGSFGNFSRGRRRKEGCKKSA